MPKTSIAAWLVAIGWFTCSPAVSAHKPPRGYTVPVMTLSPDRRYGVTVPKFSCVQGMGRRADAGNSVVEVRTGRRLAVIAAKPAFDRMPEADILPARWAVDDSLLLWNVAGKWSPWALVLLKIEGKKVQWQLNLLQAARREILARAKAASPEDYRIGQEQGRGSGSAFPDGLTVDVQVDGVGPISFPVIVHAYLTSNPKGIGYLRFDELDARLDAVVDADGKLTVTKFHLGSDPPAPNFTR